MNRYIWLRSITGLMENLFGITSPDTGNKIIKSFQRKNFTSITFNAIYGSDILIKHSKNLSNMANEFELYSLQKGTNINAYVLIRKFIGKLKRDPILIIGNY